MRKIIFSPKKYFRLQTNPMIHRKFLERKKNLRPIIFSTL